MEIDKASSLDYDECGCVEGWSWAGGVRMLSACAGISSVWFHRVTVSSLPATSFFLYSSLVESFSGYQPTPPSPLSSPVAVETREWVTHPPPFYSSWQGQHEDRTLWQDNLCHILPQSFYRSVCHVMMIMHRETPVAVRQMRDGFHRSR